MAAGLDLFLALSDHHSATSDLPPDETCGRLLYNNRIADG
jgi:hypothetical protein